MPTEGLKKAILESKTGERKELIDVLMGVAKGANLVDSAVRLLFVVEALLSSEDGKAASLSEEELRRLREQLPSEVKAALTVEARREFKRWVIQKAIEEGKNCSVPLASIKGQYELVCKGCPVSMSCVADSLSTPYMCETYGLVFRPRDNNLRRRSAGAAIVTPVKITKNQVHVTCTHPEGEYVVPIEEFYLEDPRAD